MALKPGEPCSHPGCLSHVSHPCEGCGRRAPLPRSDPLSHAIDEKMGQLYRAWAMFGPEDSYTINMLNDLMLLYDEWLD